MNSISPTELSRLDPLKFINTSPLKLEISSLLVKFNIFKSESTTMALKSNTFSRSEKSAKPTKAISRLSSFTSISPLKILLPNSPFREIEL